MDENIRPIIAFDATDGAEGFAKNWDRLERELPVYHDYMVSFVRAFRDGKADFIEIYSRNQSFQLLATALAEELKFVTSELKELDSQSSVLIVRPTALGWQFFQHSKSHNFYTLPEPK
jgi:hypothetical protein